MLRRFTVSLEDKLLAQYDQYLKARKLANRSEGVRSLIRKALVAQEIATDREVVGVISLVYNHHQRRLQDRLTEIQHRFHRDVVSTTHVHLNQDDCLEVILVRGRASRVRALADLLAALRGVKDSALHLSAAGPHLH